MKKLDLTGEMFGRLEVTGNGQYKNGHWYWECKCSCPNKSIVYATTHSLRAGNTQSCGCLKKEITSERQSKYHENDIVNGCKLIKTVGRKQGRPLWKCKCCDCGSDLEYTSKQLSTRKDNRCDECIYPNLVGMTFERLSVVDRIPDKKYKWLYVCVCSCEEHNTITAPRHNLISGNTKSCGCYKIEKNKEWGKQLRKLYPSEKKENIYIDKGTYLIGYASKTGGYDTFIIDKEDFPKMKGFTWRFNSSGYLSDVQSHEILARVIMNAKEGEVVDHIHGKYTRHDNRKINLRIGDNSLNGLNKPQNEMCGIRFTYGKYRVRISNQGKETHLGSFETLEEAIKARQEAEEKYGYGWRWADHMNDGYDWLYAEIPEEEKDKHLPKGFISVANKSDLPDYKIFANDVGIQLYTEKEVEQKQREFDSKD